MQAGAGTTHRVLEAILIYVDIHLTAVRPLDPEALQDRRNLTLTRRLLSCDRFSIQQLFIDLVNQVSKPSRLDSGSTVVRVRFTKNG
jgi:hypothetical protein